MTKNDGHRSILLRGSIVLFHDPSKQKHYHSEHAYVEQTLFDAFSCQLIDTVDRRSHDLWGKACRAKQSRAREAVAKCGRIFTNDRRLQRTCCHVIRVDSRFGRRYGVTSDLLVDLESFEYLRFYGERREHWKNVTHATGDLPDLLNGRLGRFAVVVPWSRVLGRAEWTSNANQSRWNWEPLTWSVRNWNTPIVDGCRGIVHAGSSRRWISLNYKRIGICGQKWGKDSLREARRSMGRSKRYWYS